MEVCTCSLTTRRGVSSNFQICSISNQSLDHLRDSMVPQYQIVDDWCLVERTRRGIDLSLLNRDSGMIGCR